MVISTGGPFHVEQGIGMKTYDVVVVGGGHAGIEAALAASKLGCTVALVTLRQNTVGMMPCNPAVGGLGKGHLVREVDALGGAMGLLIDRTRIQFRYLNTRKGKAVQSSRAQADRHLYQAEALRLVLQQPRLTVVEGEVVGLSAAGDRVEGLTLRGGERIGCGAVVLSTGTFLRGALHLGLRTWSGGRAGEPAARSLSRSLLDLGLRLVRMKTGTVPRLDARSIDFNQVQVQTPVHTEGRFSFGDEVPRLPPADCYITYTSARTHEVIRAGLDRSPLFSGVIQGVGPRYCPSIEDKVVRFPDKERHQIFLEPEGLGSHEVYPNGMSTSLPFDIQVSMIRSIRGLEGARILKPGYAVEYDCVDPTQLNLRLGIHGVRGLFTAGQINGTSGYEEAAAQGLLAGINASAHVRGTPALELGREQAYLGVMVSDLALKGVDEPYRMLTSRAEYRLLLREENADRRLTTLGRQVGLVSDERWERYSDRARDLERGMHLLQSQSLLPTTEVNDYLEGVGLQPLRAPVTFAGFLSRPHTSIELLLPFQPALAELPVAALDELETEARYAGYVEQQQRQARAGQDLDRVKIPEDMDFSQLLALSREARDKLKLHRPRSLGQAALIPGITPVALDLMEIALRRGRDREPAEGAV